MIVVLRFSIQEDHIIERTNVKCHAFYTFGQLIDHYVT